MADDKKIKPKLAWRGDDWVLTFISLRDPARDRSLIVQMGQKEFEIKLGLCKGSKSLVVVNISIRKRRRGDA